MIELEYLVWMLGIIFGSIYFDSEVEFLFKSLFGFKIVVVVDDKVVGIFGYKFFILFVINKYVVEIDIVVYLDY